MSLGKLLLWFGGSALVTSTAAFEIATFTNLRNSSYGYQIPPIALLAGLAGLFAAVAGCILVSLKTEGRKLVVAGLAIPGVVFLIVSILNHFNPELFNMHIGFGGFVAPMATSVLIGLICLVMGIIRLRWKLNNSRTKPL